jgi:K+-transporting ATPase ATPase A chain
MNTSNLLQIGLFLAVLLALAIPLGNYMALVYGRDSATKGRFGSLCGKIEGVFYKICRINTTEMTWLTYAKAMLIFNAIGMFFIYLVQRLQNILPLDPEKLAAVSPDCAFNTAISFASNTNWQSYGGETTMSYLTQMLALTSQNFLSAASGMAVLVALIRAFNRQQVNTIGNFFVDLTRSILFILLPLCTAFAIALVAQGTVQTFAGYCQYTPVEQLQSASAQTEQLKIARGPAASQIAIKQLGTNGGGFFNTNSSHPLENPTPLSNFLQMLAILIIPAALCQTFGTMVKSKRNGLALLAAMTIILGGCLAVCASAEISGNPAFQAMHINMVSNDTNCGGNMEGKEVRFGPVNSAIWAVATTAASNGSVNSMHDSFTPLGGLIPLLLMQLGEVVFGGVGSGLYGMIVFAIITVFIAGLMVGRTPEYLGKKIEAFEMKMSSLVILFPPLVVLLGTALAVSCKDGMAGVLNTGPHGFSEILYAFSSAGNNNGSAFAGLSANTPFYNYALGVAMFIGRYALAVPVLALAGSLVSKKKIPASGGTMATDNSLFVALLIGVVLIFGGLTFVPSLALGPVVEQLQMMNPGT